MIYLHTGQPGAGKTLLTLDMVRSRAKAENRPVFYAGIEILKPELFPGWQVLENPERWMDCPDGAIIIHDECQTLYRPRGNGAQVPEYVARFETHRHNGWDIYLITQHPMLVDSNIRRLAGEHMHVVRAFGAKMATLHRWGQVKEQCDKTRSDSVSTTRAYPAELFDAYKSATVHTHKTRIPARMLFLLLIPALLGLLAWWFATWYQSKANGEQFESLTDRGAGSEVTAARVPSLGSGSGRPGPKSTAEWLREHEPRVVGLPHTAPVYDQVVRVAEAPYPQICIASASRCVCYTQQGTRMGVPDELCRRIAQDGYFVAWQSSMPTQQARGMHAAAATPTVRAMPQADQVARANPYIRNAGTYAGVPAR